MGKDEDLAKVFLTALLSLPMAGRDRVLLGLVRDRTLRRELVDLAVIEERSSEPSRPFRDYQRKGRSLWLRPRKKSWAALGESLDRFTDDFMKDGRNQPHIWRGAGR